MIQFRDILPLSAFKKDTPEYLSRLETNGGPFLLTVHGRGAFVLEHINSYMQTAHFAEMAMQDQELKNVVNRFQRGERRARHSLSLPSE